MTINRITDEMQKSLPKTSLYDNHYGQDYFEIPVGEGQVSGKVVVKPFSHDFQFNTVEGATIMPVNLSDIDRKKRSFAAKILGVFTSAFSTPKDPNLSTHTLPYKGVIAKGNEEIIKNLYPSATLEKAGEVWVVIQQTQKDIYNKAKELIGSKIEGYEALLERSLLSPCVRQKLEECGEIIYESNPEGADRTIVCFANVHGDYLSPFKLQAFSQGGDLEFMQHQYRIATAISSSIIEMSDRTSHLFLESFPDSDIAEQKADFQSTISVESMFKKQAEFISQNSSELADYLQLFRSGQSFLIDIYHQTKRLQLHGDNRQKYIKYFKEKNDRLINTQRLAQISLDSAGLASSVCHQKQEVRQEMMYGPNGGVTAQIAKHVSAGEVAFLVYGAGHFSSYCKDGAFDSKKSLEEYLSFLPRTQIVVVLPHGSEELHFKIRQQIDLMNKLKPEKCMMLTALEALLSNCYYLLLQQVRDGKEEEALKYMIQMKEIVEEMKKFIDDEKFAS